MGWKLKGLTLFFALVLFPFAWIISILLLFYVFSGFILRRKKQQRIVVQMVPPPGQPQGAPYVPVQYSADQLPPDGASRRGRLSGKSSLRYFIGGVFVILALIALGDGGRLSPVVFGSVGAILILWVPFSKLARISVLNPVADSTLLRSRIPFLWVGLAEVKLATQLPPRPVSSVRERLLIFATESPSIHLVVQRFAFDHRGAEDKVFERMREIAKAMAPLGAYLLPIDSSKAAERLTTSLDELKIDPDKWRQNLPAVHYDVLAVESKDGYVDSFSAYVKDGKRPRDRPNLPHVGRKPSRRPLLWEVLHQVGMRVRWPGPDATTAFLSSVAATENAMVGERVTDMGQAQDPQTVRVRSVGSPTVELSRAELRAIMRIYSQPVKEGAVQTILEMIRA
jgi:hypothetical protein